MKAQETWKVAKSCETLQYFLQPCRHYLQPFMKQCKQCNKFCNLSLNAARLQTLQWNISIAMFATLQTLQCKVTSAFATFHQKNCKVANISWNIANIAKFGWKVAKFGWNVAKFIALFEMLHEMLQSIHLNIKILKKYN